MPFVGLFIALSSLMGQSSTIINDSVMMIGPDVESLTEEERYFNPTYLVVDPSKEHLKQQLIRASVCDCDTIIPNRRIGIFSVSKDKQVSFSQGNLQYLPAANLWKFADEQYEYLHSSNKYTSSTYRNWIDLFGWSSNSSTAPFGVSISTNNADYAGNFVDWGVNEICGDAAGTWRTLSADEWEYLLEKRANAAQLYGVAKVDGVNGLIILPDVWVCPEGHSFKHGLHAVQVDDYEVYQSFDAEEWQRMEAAGAVFLSASGFRDGITVEKSNLSGYYWSSTSVSQTDAYRMYFYSYFLGAKDTHSKYRGRAVRLVHDTIVPPPAPCQTFTVNGVTFNMMCVEGGTFTMSDGLSYAHPVTLSDYYIGQTEVTQALWKAVMGEVPAEQEILGDEYPVAMVSLADCRLFAERLSNLTGRHFRVPTEAEWEYAARGGNRSKGFTYAGSDDIEEVAWYKDNMTEYQPHPVAQKKPNELGTYDMTGNLCEWVSDWAAPLTKYPQVNPTGAVVHSTPGRPMSYRGGCWTYAAETCTSITRHSFANRAANGIGLRLAMSDEEPFRAVYLNDTTRFYLRPVKKGTFMMGSREDDPIIQQNLAAKADELPQHKVTLDSDYWVAEYELTQAIWTAVMGTDIYDLQAALNKPTSEVIVAAPGYPMYFVYTKDVFEFTRRLSKLTGLNFRLPTEAEWEFAARGGNLSHGYLYAGSNDPDSVAWYNKSTTSDLQLVGQKMPNELGIYDMSGNVLERCIDYLEYHQPYDPNDTLNPRGKLLQSGNRAYRGGAHNMHKDSIRVTHRAPQTPTFTSKNVGTRLVVNDEHHFQTFNIGSVWFDMIFVKGGTFQMGCTTEMDAEAYAHEAPVHQVTLSDFYIGQIEVTQRLWQTVMGSNPSTIKDTNSPVNNVSWEDCQAFIAKLNQLTGHNFRLPTEAEWEYAARGGHKSQGYKYAGSNNIDEVAWYSGNTGGTFKNFAKKRPNELDIYDMSGNVWEWCQDWYGPYTADAQVNPQGPTTGEYRMYRGGGWKYADKDCRVARRRQTASYDKTSLGLRLVLDTAAYVPVPTEPGRRIGVFSVGKGKQVSFSQGNLQYNRQCDKWHFAANQYEYIGEENIKDNQLANRIDLFGWSSDSGKAPYGVSTSTTAADYKGNFVDWGTNTIQGDTAGTWRTLSKDEWDYLFKGRKNAASLRGAAQVNGVNGHILLPDEWECPNGITFNAGYPSNKGSEYYAAHQQFSQTEWILLEASGAIFLPAAGQHDGSGIADIQSGGYYWSATANGDAYAYTLLSQSTGAYVTYDNRYDVRSVRLVHDTIVPPPAPCETITVNGVSFNMMCVEGGTFTMGAAASDSTASANEKIQHEVSLSDYLMAQTEVTKELWLAVMGEKPHGASSTWGTGEITTPANYVSWKECVEFAQRLSQLTGRNFRLPTEAEWEYAARGGNKSRGYRYSGSDNLDEVGWYIDNRQSTTHPVAQKRPNELGIYDMSGNVWEWCLDSPKEYDTQSQNDPMGAFYNNRRVIRGGAYERNEHRCTNTHRTTWLSAWSNQGANTGFRIVLNDEHIIRTIILPDSIAFNMKFVEGGTFTMGAEEDDTTAEADEKPQHQVTVSDFMIGQTEVTQQLWKAVMGSNPSSMKGDLLPVESVTWAECQEFVAKLSQLTGLNFRLPTEAEWEYAAKGGQRSRGYKYAGSDNLEDVAWMESNSGNKTQNIGTKLPNELGIYDMSGNVYERCQDWYGPYSAEAQVNPQGPTQGTWYAARGGSYLKQSNLTSESACRILNRGYSRPTSKESQTGLRLVLDPHPYVDLGLSVLWATTNVGATTPEEYGDYYAWGETETKDFYGWSTYKWCNGTDNTLTKYCSNPSLGADGFTDGLTTLLPEDDAAHVHWGAMWRMATKSEFRELIDNCRWETTTLNGVKGYRVTSTVPGYTDRSIFLPLAGYHNHDLGASNVGISVRYWSSSGSNTSASDLYMATLEGNTRRIGMSIRPVLPTHRKINTPNTEPSKRVGLFSVGKGTHVTFSQGNLVYLKLKKQWLFAPNQLYYTGERHLQDGQIADTVMYFGWSAKDSKAPWGISTSTNLDHYKGEFLDWGTNTIQGDKPNTWRTMTDEEMVYLFEGRPNAAQLIGFAEVNGIHGMIILPDDWQLPEGLSFTPYDGSTVNHYTQAQWQQMEDAGAVIIPAAGYFNNKLSPKMRFVNEHSILPYSILLDSVHQQYTYIKPENIIQRWPGNNTGNLFYAFPRRLVHDTIIPFEPEYVDLGLSVLWATTNIGANFPEEYGDYFAWGETQPKDNFTWENYTWCDGTKSTITKYNATDGLTTLLPEDDAAYVNWGRGWRMPTNDELTELRTSCTWEAMTKDGVKGIQVTGPNGNSIFIPLGGSYNTFDDQLNSVGNHGWLYSSTRASADNQAREIGISSSGGAQTSCSRCLGLNIRPVFPKSDDGKVTVTIVPTQSDATVSLLCIGYTREGNSITVDKGKSVLYLVSNVDNGYLSQGDSLLNLTRDTTLYVTLEPFSDGVWETVDDSLLAYTPDCYISRNSCAFAKYESWSYYVMPVSEGETYRIQTIAGQHAAPWIAVSSLPDFATETRAKQIACSPIKGPTGYLAEEFTVPAGTKYLIINRRESNTNPLKVEKKSFYKTYHYGFTDEQFAAATSTWNPPGMGWAIIDQSPIQGKVLYGIRMKVAKAGSFNLYKVTTLAETSESNMQFVTTVTTSKTGLQDIDFEVPFYLAANEYLVVSRPSDASTTTLVGNHMTSDNMLQPFYRQVGTTTVSKASVSSLMVDFY